MSKKIISIIALVTAVLALVIITPKAEAAVLCYKGVNINQSYNASVSKYVWTQGVGSSDQNSIQGYNSVSDAQSYINTLYNLGYSYNQCYSAPDTTTKPSVTTISASADQNGVTLQGSLNSLGSYSSVQVAFDLYQQDPGTTVYTKITEAQTRTYTGSYSIYTSYPSQSVSNWCYRARVIFNGNDFALGNERCFVKPGGYTPPPTPSVTLPTVQTTAASYSNGNLSMTGYLSSTGNASNETGFYIYKQYEGFNQYSARKEISTYSQSYTGSFSKNSYNGLEQNTYYCVRAYARNSAGEAQAFSYYDRCFRTEYTPPTPSKTLPTVQTSGASYANKYLTMTGYLSGTGNDTNEVGFYIYKQYEGFNQYTARKEISTYSQSYTGSFTKSLYNNLESNTYYCVRAYAKNSMGETQASSYYDKCFRTDYYTQPSQNIPTVQTTAANYNTATKYVDFSGYVTSFGSDTGAEVGFYYYKQSEGFNQYYAQRVVAYSRTAYIGNFAQSVYAGGLAQNTYYCARAFAKNIYGEALASSAEDKCFLTGYNGYPYPDKTLPTVQTNGTTYYNGNLSMTGYLTNTGNDLNETGFYIYKQYEGFNQYTARKEIANYSQNVVGQFSKATYNGLDYNTTYCVRAYAKNSLGEVQSSSYYDKCFTTNYGSQPTVTWPQVQTKSAYHSSGSLTMIGNLFSTGNGTNETGFFIFKQYSGFNETTALKEVVEYNRTTIGDFSKTISTSGLEPNTYYCVRAYARNSYARNIASYLQDKCFLTQYTAPTPVTPVVQTMSASYSAGNVNMIGNLQSLGNDTSAQTGFYIYKQSAGFNQTTALKEVANYSQSITGQFIKNSVLNNLEPGTIYCVRAYANNTAGEMIAESYEKCFRTDYAAPNPTLPTVQTSAVSYYTNTVSMSGYLSFTGNSLTETGFYIFKQAVGFDQSTARREVANAGQSSIGAFNKTASTSGLEADTFYCVRAYGRNTAGEVQSNDLYDRCFKTQAVVIPPPSGDVKIEVNKSAIALDEPLKAELILTLNCTAAICRNVVVYDVLPEGISYVSNSATPPVSYLWPFNGVSGRKLVWSIGTMYQGQKDIKFKIKFATSTPDQLTNVYPDSKVTYWGNNNQILETVFPETKVTPKAP